MLFDQVTIIGMGLMGSSLARVIRQKDICRTIIASDHSESVCHEVVQLGLADIVTDEIDRAVEGSDLVIVAVPVGGYKAVGERIGPSLKAGACVIDVGSVKQSVIQAFTPLLPESVHFIPCHPIAGTEHSGPGAGMANLFEGRWCIFTPLPATDLRTIEKVTRFWEACGAKIEIMDAAHHDLIMGITSHLPHLIAFTIVGTATELEDDMKSEVIQFSASGFRSFTRIAASDPVMWRDIFLNNREAVLEALQRFTEDLTAMQKAIRRGDGNHLLEVFERTRTIRRGIMGLGPEGFPFPPRLEDQA